MTHLLNILLPEIAKKVSTGFLSIGTRSRMHLDDFLVPVRVATLVDGVQLILWKHNFPWPRCAAKTVKSQHARRAAQRGPSYPSRSCRIACFAGAHEKQPCLKGSVGGGHRFMASNQTGFGMAPPLTRLSTFSSSARPPCTATRRPLLYLPILRTV